MMMNEFEKKVLAFCRKNGLFEPGEKVIVALSGGADSMALLCCLLALQEALGVTVSAAHLNHGIRENAKEDEAFCEDFCRQKGIPFYKKTCDVPVVSEKIGESLETAGRHCRYEFFDRLLKTEKSDKIALAHHMDDQAETLLMHLLRGAGSAGLGGMRAIRSDAYVRPLLGVTKAEILAYLNDIDQSFCIDETNASKEYFRNQIRLELIPKLNRYNPNAVQLLAQTAGLLADEHDYLKSEAQAWIDKSKEGISFSKKAFLSLAPALQRQVLRDSFHRELNTVRDLTYQQIESARELIASETPGRKLDFPNGAALVTSYETFHWQKKENSSFNWEAFVLKLNELQKSDAFGATFHLYKVPVEEYLSMEKEASFEAFDAEILDKAIEVRAFIPGDRMAPFGMEGTKKVQDLFTDMKVPRFLRSQIPIVVQDGRVLWIPGVRRSRDFLVHEHTKEVVIIHISGGKWHA